MTSQRRNRTRAVAGAAVTALAAAAALSSAGAAEAATHTSDTAAAPGITLPAGFHATVFAKGSGTALYDPDDITEMDNHVFIAFQNGVGTMGEPSPSGNTKSTVVEYSPEGRVLNQWSVVGKVDGMGADPVHHRVIATANEDGNSSLYTITLGCDGHMADVQDYSYTQNPLPHGGGTDAVVVHEGTVYISASNPSPNAQNDFTNAALFEAHFEGGKVRLTPALMGDATATSATTGQSVTLNLSDPDSNGVVPRFAPRFGGDVFLDSQGDGELIFLKNADRHDQQATVLDLNTQVDDTVFARGPLDTLLVDDTKANDVIAVTGPFTRGEAFSAVPGDSTVDPGTLGSLNLSTGQVSTFGSGFQSPQGMLFLKASDGDDQQ